MQHMAPSELSGNAQKNLLTINQTFEFSLTPARIPFIPITPRRRIPSLPIESSSSISSMLQLNDWDRDQSTIAPITCNMPRNGRVSQGDPSLQKFALKQQEPSNVNMEVDTPCLPTTEEPSTPSTPPSPMMITKDILPFSPPTANQGAAAVIVLPDKPIVINLKLPPPQIVPNQPNDSQEIVWNEWGYKDLCSKSAEVYNEVVHFRRNLFKLPTGRAGKEFINELTFWLRQFNSVTKLNGISIRIFMILPSLLLQKPSARSKAKDHAVALERRVASWRKGQIEELLKEAKTIQRQFKASNKPRRQEDLAKTFAKLVMEGKVSSAMKLLDKANNAGLLDLNDEVITELKDKHPEPEPATDYNLLQGPINEVPSYFFNPIDEQTVMTHLRKHVPNFKMTWFLQ